MQCYQNLAIQRCARRYLPEAASHFDDPQFAEELDRRSGWILRDVQRPGF